MTVRRLNLIVLLLMLAGLTATVCVADDKAPYTWYVNANGEEGSLQIVPGEGGQVSGTLLGQPVDGWLVGRHLVLVRSTPDGRETWEGWVASSAGTAGRDQPVIAGTLTRSGEDGPLPWFGAARSLDELIAAMPEQRPVERRRQTTTAARTYSEPQLPTARSPEAQSTVAPRLPTGEPDLAGQWSTPDGPLEIRQDGSRLTFVLPDREVEGRLIGAETLIGGFGPGCCKGQLEQAFTVIAWDNGTRWYRQ